MPHPRGRVRRAPPFYDGGHTGEVHVGHRISNDPDQDRVPLRIVQALACLGEHRRVALCRLIRVQVVGRFSLQEWRGSPQRADGEIDLYQCLGLEREWLGKGTRVATPLRPERVLTRAGRLQPEPTTQVRADPKARLILGVEKDDDGTGDRQPGLSVPQYPFHSLGL